MVAWLWLGEQLDLLQIAGAAVVLVGIVLAQTARSTKTVVDADLAIRTGSVPTQRLSSNVGGRTYVRIMDLLELPTPLPLRATPRGLDIVPRRGALWRVARTDGLVLGYVERVDDEGGEATRYRSKRMIGRAAGFTVLGDFGAADDAVEALRY